MALADFFNPTQPQGQQQSTVQGWRDWVSSPQGRAALIQFGATLSQPMGIGQNTLGHIGRAVGSGFEARDRTTAAQIEQERFEQERQDRLAQQAQRQQQFEATHSLQREELELMRPLREAQTARQMRLATQPPTGATGAAWGPASRQLKTLIDAYNNIDPINLPEGQDVPPPFEDWAMDNFGFDVAQLHQEAQNERAAYQARFGIQGQPQPTAGQPQPPASAGQPQIGPKPTKEVVSDPAGQDVLQSIVEGLMSNDAAVKAAAQQKLARLRLYVTDPDELDRFFEQKLQQRMRSNRAAPAG